MRKFEEPAIEVVSFETEAVADVPGGGTGGSSITDIPQE